MIDNISRLYTKDRRLATGMMPNPIVKRCREESWNMKSGDQGVGLRRKYTYYVSPGLHTVKPYRVPGDTWYRNERRIMPSQASVKQRGLVRLSRDSGS